ncbi:hypothetical protein PDY_11570 [Photobacterium damselae subsp. damselae]|nr:hypothetical protein BST98_06455 [Photobacterium damselae]ODA26340.1 hypothetical protein A0J46_02925 [Photobacterium damselae subsp. damselae]PSW86754.1 hypothetical protein CTN07_03800 [Photobacterium damselae]BDR34109.1 hypothetical protein PDY_11570 [Photobacterium damselae subsp. damselae]
MYKNSEQKWYEGKKELNSMIKIKKGHLASRCQRDVTFASINNEQEFRIKKKSVSLEVVAS